MYTLRYLGEIWKPVKGYEGLYEVSNFGRVRSVDRWVRSRGNTYKLCKGIILKGDPGKLGYIRVTLSREQKTKRYLVHRLVAAAFLPNPNNYPMINHKDENPTNNAVWNLEWCDCKYNNTYNNLVERRIETRRSRGTAITDPKPVIGISLTDGSVIKYESAIAALKDGFHNVGMCIRGQRRSAGGYKWYYAT